MYKMDVNGQLQIGEVPGTHWRGGWKDQEFDVHGTVHR